MLSDEIDIYADLDGGQYVMKNKEVLINVAQEVPNF
jgi:hypothetical protein